MDDCLSPESLSEAALRTLLTRERAHRQDLEQEVVRLQAGLARQNAVMIQLQQRDATRERELSEYRTLVAGLTEPGTRVRVCVLRQQVAQAEQETAKVRGQSLGKPPAAVPEQKPATLPREKKTRTKRDASHNRGRNRHPKGTRHANRWETHAVEHCPGCGEQLSGGWVARRVQVIDLPPVAPLEITEHRIIRRQCTRCGQQVLPPPVGQTAGRLGQCRFGPRLIATVAVMATRDHLPVRTIQERLERGYGLTISLGGIIGLLYRMMRAATPTYQQLQCDVRAGPVAGTLSVSDETGWRESGQRSQRIPCAVRRPAEAIWTVSTAQTVYVYHGVLHCAYLLPSRASLNTVSLRPVDGFPVLRGGGGISRR